MDVYLKEFEPGLFGYDLQAADTDTLGEYVDALNKFQDETMAECRGCDGCCYERIPLTIADFCLAKPLVARLTGKAEEDVTLIDWLQEVAEIYEDSGAIDIVLRRKADLSCHFLNQDLQECSEHLWRPLVCRTHCCLPKSPIAIDIRGDIINAGEDELCRQLLAIPDHPWRDLLSECRLEDYAESGFSHATGDGWQQIPLKSIISTENWENLLSKEK